MEKTEKRKVVIIYHDADPDGLMSRAIIEKYIAFEVNLFGDGRQVEVVPIGYNYQKDEPTIKAILDASEGAFVYMVDVTLPIASLPILMDCCAHLVVIDHHEAALAQYLATGKFHEFVIDAEQDEFAKLLPKSDLRFDSSDSHRGALVAFIQQRDWFQKCFAVVHNFKKDCDNKGFFPVSRYDKEKVLVEDKVSNFSAAELCYRSLSGFCANRAVELIGNYDTYRYKKIKPDFWENEVLPFRFACDLMDIGMYHEMLDDEDPNYDIRFDKLMKAGKAAMMYQAAKDRQAMSDVRIVNMEDAALAKSVGLKVATHKVALINAQTSGRDFWAQYDPAIHGSRVDIFASYVIVGGEVRLSLRKTPWANVNVADIAKRLFGGGGHPEAAGAAIPALFFWEKVVKL